MASNFITRFFTGFNASQQRGDSGGSGRSKGNKAQWSGNRVPLFLMLDERYLTSHFSKTPEVCKQFNAVRRSMAPITSHPCNVGAGRHAHLVHPNPSVIRKSIKSVCTDFFREWAPRIIMRYGHMADAFRIECDPNLMMLGIMMSTVRLHSFHLNALYNASPLYAFSSLVFMQTTGVIRSVDIPHLSEEPGPFVGPVDSNGLFYDIQSHGVVPDLLCDRKAATPVGYYRYQHCLKDGGTPTEHYRYGYIESGSYVGDVYMPYPTFVTIIIKNKMDPYLGMPVTSHAARMITSEYPFYAGWLYHAANGIALFCSSADEYVTAGLVSKGDGMQLIDDMTISDYSTDYLEEMGFLFSDPTLLDADTE